MATGYKNNRATKTIILPIPMGGEGDLSYQEYKERYGIDLKEVIDLDSSHGNVIFKENVILLIKSQDYPNLPINVPPNNFIIADYESGSSDLDLQLWYQDSTAAMGYGVRFLISQDDPFDWDHLVIGPMEF